MPRRLDNGVWSHYNGKQLIISNHKSEQEKITLHYPPEQREDVWERVRRQYYEFTECPTAGRR